MQMQNLGSLRLLAKFRSVSETLATVNNLANS